MLRALLIKAICFLLFATMSHADTRAAFVVGNSGYLNAPRLANPVRDARLLARTLEDLEFDVALHEDLTRDGFSAALGDFLRANRDADVTLVYFAGHGMQFKGRNYLVATDAALRSELDIDSETIALDMVVELVERNSKAALFFIDACRDNPLATDFYRRNFSETRALETRGLARYRARSDGSMLVFAAAPGQVAYDGAGLNSPFATALARHLPTENKEVLSLTKRIIRDVRDATDGRQSPIVTNDLTTEVFLREAALRPETTGPVAPESSRSELPRVSDETLAFLSEAEAFETAKADGTPLAWAIYFHAFPRGQFTNTALALEQMDLENAFRAASPGRSVGRTLNLAQSADFFGLSRTDRQELQRSLQFRNLYDGSIDGILGPQTRSSLLSHQRRLGLPETGVLSRPTLVSLGLSSVVERFVDRGENR